MNINKEQIDDLNLLISVQIEKDDYSSKVNEILRNYRRKAKIPGFRPGKIPEGLIRKMYGKAVMIDEINKLVSESLQKYIEKELLNVLGGPLPKTKSDDLDWELGNDFSLEFEIGISPEIEVNLSKGIELTKYHIIVDNEAINNEIVRLSRQHGQLTEVDSVSDFTEKLTGDLIEMDGNEISQIGLLVEDTNILLSLIKNDELKKPFENVKVGDEIVFNLSETFPNDWEIASILKKKTKEEVGDISASMFKFTVKNVQRWASAEMNQEFFDKVFGEGKAGDLAEFTKLIEQQVDNNYEESSISKFNYDFNEYLLEKINPPLPEEYLRKWLLATKEKLDDETVENDFPIFLKNKKLELLLNAIARQYELDVDDAELLEMVKNTIKKQYSVYGINMPDETISNYAANYLKEEKNVRTMASQVLQEKITKLVLEKVDLTIREISVEDFNSMISANNTEQ